MEHIKQIFRNPTPYRGSQETADRVREEVRQRWGDEAANNYDPKTNCMIAKEWRKRSYFIKKGESAIRSVTMLEQKDSKGNVIKKYYRTVFLFFLSQVQPSTH